jgi:hypothetical protein
MKEKIEGGRKGKIIPEALFPEPKTDHPNGREFRHALAREKLHHLLARPPLRLHTTLATEARANRRR